MSAQPQHARATLYEAMKSVIAAILEAKEHEMRESVIKVFNGAEAYVEQYDKAEKIEERTPEEAVARLLPHPAAAKEEVKPVTLAQVREKQAAFQNQPRVLELTAKINEVLLSGKPFPVVFEMPADEYPRSVVKEVVGSFSRMPCLVEIQYLYWIEDDEEALTGTVRLTFKPRDTPWVSVFGDKLNGKGLHQ